MNTNIVCALFKPDRKEKKEKQKSLNFFACDRTISKALQNNGSEKLIKM
jgi:hypothetical protein